MPSLHRLGTCLFTCVLAVSGCHSVDYIVRSSDYRSPSHFKEDIQRFEASDKQVFPPANAVVCAGSSSIRMWHPKLSKDLEPLTVIPRGFGGSNMNDLLYYADRIVLKYQPRAVLIYEGDNDIAQGVSPRRIAATFEQLLDKIHQAQPGCRVYVLPAKPSLMRWKLWPKMLKLNERLAEIAANDPLVTYIDIATPMLGEDGRPRKELFIDDGLHLNRKGYELWRDTIRPVLVEAERAYEAESQDTP